MSTKDQGGSSVIEQLSAYVATESFDKLPDATVRAARRAILDTLGVMLAGSAEVTAARVRALIAHRRGVEEATVAGTDLRASVEDAALANGTAAHALDYDDVQQSLSGHPSVPILPAALALAERQHASGAALLVAFVAGVEVEAKLGRAIHPDPLRDGLACHIHPGRLRRRRRSGQTARPLGRAHRARAGHRRVHGERHQGELGTDGKPWHAGHAGRCGIEAALLAEAGFTGNPRALEHRDGFGATYGAGSVPAWDLVTAGLGAPHEVVDPGIGVKRYPACASTHQALDATLALAEEHAIDASAVETAECAVHYLAPHQLIYDRAETPLQGKFSMAYCVAVALLDRSVGLAQFTDDRVRRADVQALMPRIRMVIHPEQTTRDCLPTRFSEVTLTLRDGRRLVRRVRHAKGQPQNPLTDAELTAKFRDAATRVLPAERAESILSAVHGLDGLADVGALARLLIVGAH